MNAGNLYANTLAPPTLIVSLAYVLIIVLHVLAWIDFLKSTILSRRTDTYGLANIQMLASRYLYDGRPYLSLFFLSYVKNLTEKSEPFVQDSGVSTVRSAIASRFTSVIYLLGVAILLFILFGYLVEPHNIVVKDMTRIFGVQVGYSLFLGLLVVLQANMISDLLLTAYCWVTEKSKE